MKKDIAIFGFGGFSREVASIISMINKEKPTWNLVGFFDEGFPSGETNRYGKVLGGIELLNQWSKPLGVILAIATPAIVRNVKSRINNPNLFFPNIIAPTVLLFDPATLMIGQGNVICHNCRMSCDVVIGSFNILNGGVSLGHDVELGDYNVMQPEVRISGGTKIGNDNFFGVRSLALQMLKIGDRTRIGTGSTIMRNTKDDMTYFGNPAKIMKI